MKLRLSLLVVTFSGISAMAQLPPATPSPAATAGALPANVRQALFGSAWSWLHPPDGEEEIVFTPDGRAKHPLFEAPWTVTGPRTITLRRQDEKTATLIFDPTLNRFDGTDFGGLRRITGKRRTPFAGPPVPATPSPIAAPKGATPAPFPTASATPRPANLPPAAPLDAVRMERIFSTIRDALRAKKIGRTALAGGDGGERSEDLAANGAVLVGFQYAEAKFQRKFTIVKSLQGIYLTPQGQVTGEPFGGGDRTLTLLAQPGYAVASIALLHGGRIDGFQVTFQRIKTIPFGLDARDAYTSDWIGGKKEDGPNATLTSGGRPIIGLAARSGGDLHALGLIYAE